jgi:hypothetical protein
MFDWVCQQSKLLVPHHMLLHWGVPATGYFWMRVPQRWIVRLRYLLLKLYTSRSQPVGNWSLLRRTRNRLGNYNRDWPFYLPRTSSMFGSLATEPSHLAEEDSRLLLTVGVLTMPRGLLFFFSLLLLSMAS